MSSVPYNIYFPPLNRHTRVSRFQLLARLKQHFLVEGNSRIVDYRLNWQTAHFSHLAQLEEKAADAKDAAGLVVEADTLDSDIPPLTSDDEDEVGNKPYTQKTFLGDHHTGSPRHLAKLASDSLTIVSELGKPTVFITLTVNPQWPEIQQMLLPGQTAYEREDIVNQVCFRSIIFLFMQSYVVLLIVRFLNNGFQHYYITCVMVTILMVPLLIILCR